ncbi:serine protease 40-like [Armigeres subalbatus]|uniref:serine protease 40-like n=1 Tax=Armigeres subalbatus TaxID=124917 RepID=UPI002ED3EC6A
MYATSMAKYFPVFLLLFPFPDICNSHECGRRTYTQLPLIYGGKTSSPGEWPWHAAIYHLGTIRSTSSYQCGGTLISSEFVLTAAHCTFRNGIPLPANHFIVKLGSYNLNTEEDHRSEYGVGLVERHFKYNPWAHQYDVALLQMENKVEFSNFIQPVCLPADANAHQFSHGNVVGWGFGDRNQMETVLQKANLHVVDYATCLRSNAILFSVLLSKDYSNFCAGNDNMTNVCDGDSGGGLFSFNKIDGAWYIRGVTNAGVRVDPALNMRCNPRQFTVFSNVTYYMNWIRSVQNRREANLLDLKDCGEDDHDPSVPESDKPMFQQYPWMALLEHGNSNSTKIETVCSGVLIHSQFVLTTGHCTCATCNGIKPKAVRIGDYDLLKNPETDLDGIEVEAESIPILKIIHHPEMDLSVYRHNIAVIKLAREPNFRLPQPIKPICLPTTRSFSGNNYVVGWRRAGKSNVLERESVILEHIKQCNNIYSAIKVNLDPEESIICVDNKINNKNCISYKAGSALLYQAQLDGNNRYYLKGLHVLGLPRCGPKSKDVFIDVSHYLEWIKQTVDLEIARK